MRDRNGGMVQKRKRKVMMGSSMISTGGLRSGDDDGWRRGMEVAAVAGIVSWGPSRWVVVVLVGLLGFVYLHCKAFDELGFFF